MNFQMTIQSLVPLEFIEFVLSSSSYPYEFTKWEQYGVTLPISVAAAVVLVATGSVDRMYVHGRRKCSFFHTILWINWIFQFSRSNYFMDMALFF